MNRAFLGLQRRAEQGDPAVLVQTFVDVGPLFTLLSSVDHQILYGRRGTGKTHALQYLRARVRERGDFAAYIDLRTVGSSGGLYGDSGVPIPERGTRLASDVLTQLIEQLTQYLVESSDAGRDVTMAMALLDRLEDAVVDVRIVGEHESETTAISSTTLGEETELGVKLEQSGPVIEASSGSNESSSDQLSARARVIGVERHHVHFGQASSVLKRLVAALPAQRLWILLDEWVAIPLELQPLLGDLLRRAVLPVPGITVKMAAIEQRSSFRVDSVGGDYVGLELGADIQADVDLDDYMVFENDADRAKEFFRELLFRHVCALMEDEGLGDPPATAAELQSQAFTQRTAIDDFVRAAEGVPRDAINILRLAAQRADSAPITVEHVRAAARRWYLGDKEKDVPPDAKALLHWIVDKVIGERRARAFLLQQPDRDDTLIGTLYDARVLHVIKRGVAAQDRAGVRFDVYAIDYGCYVELINTAKAPEGLYEADEEETSVEVPANDYRSIRRAILELGDFRGASADTDRGVE
jgi:hypothetical protein